MIGVPDQQGRGDQTLTLDRATEAIRGALAEGGVTPDEVATLTGLVEARRRLLETTELERRLAALEQQQPARAT